MITIATVRDRRVDTGILILRVVVGIVFIAHGWQKFFVAGIGNTTMGFSQMGVPMPEVMAPLVSGIELIGGLALVLGLLTRVFAGLLAIDMLGAMFLVHLANGFFLPAGYEFVLTLLAASISLILTGPGMMSIDDALDKRRTVEFADTGRTFVRERHPVVDGETPEVIEK